ncbi:MAG TPA: type II toxin-antitoxin system VapC family toxin [Candidatus Sumerlaeota bacterium]|nr:type II toxin-antitoxin system VapC family toxin [Candidatus Sumerlaeota bacterium]HPS01780.1 type II toxin-antitoxin system VapC family toxin [Candidatus Sumerlaeota bacterium]
MKPAFVLDCSVAMSWCFADEENPYAEMVLDRLATTAAVVPTLWRLESANVLLAAERHRRITHIEMMRLAAFLSDLPIQEDAETTRHGFARILELGHTYHLTAYDAAYLELALRLGLPLATLDQPLGRAARDAGLPLLEES